MYTQSLRWLSLLIFGPVAVGGCGVGSFLFFQRIIRQQEGKPRKSLAAAYGRAPARPVRHPFLVHFQWEAQRLSPHRGSSLHLPLICALPPTVPQLGGPARRPEEFCCRFRVFSLVRRCRRRWTFERGRRSIFIPILLFFIYIFIYYFFSYSLVGKFYIVVRCPLLYIYIYLYIRYDAVRSFRLIRFDWFEVSGPDHGMSQPRCRFRNPRF